MILALITGFVFGFGLILPLGPQNMFILSQGMRNTNILQLMAVVITAALSDTLLILLATLGLTTLVFEITWLKSVIFIAGIGFLSYLSWHSWRRAPIHQFEWRHEKRGLGILILFTLSVSWLNPYAIIDTVFTMGSMSLIYRGMERLMFVSGCILASWVWFSILMVFGHKLRQFKFIRVNEGKISALIIAAAALFLLFYFIRSTLQP